ncbi:hypothetical protein EX30DRAFT_39168 [Ascodesmis nigricans]|uniref:Uncharacterized protein n=1 Tax=Ascodesmis nigricans TaxID=341454 RepID=A0A4S2MW85_9PEZI|nr:hypothetical protein EX30DRAFT_39168 [Ascodesmis nigricans]
MQRKKNPPKRQSRTGKTPYQHEAEAEAKSSTAAKTTRERKGNRQRKESINKGNHAKQGVSEPSTSNQPAKPTNQCRKRKHQQRSNKSQSICSISPSPPFPATTKTKAPFCCSQPKKSDPRRRMQCIPNHSNRHHNIIITAPFPGALSLHHTALHGVARHGMNSHPLNPGRSNAPATDAAIFRATAAPERSDDNKHQHAHCGRTHHLPGSLHRLARARFGGRDLSPLRLPSLLVHRLSLVLFHRWGWGRWL